MAIVEFKNFSWKYLGSDKQILKNINLKFNKGEFIGIIGNIDSGRSSLCYSILGLIPHFYPGKMDGEIIVDGVSVGESKISELSTRVGLVFQTPANQLTGAGTSVEEELAFGLENLGVGRSEMIKRVDETIKLIGLDKFRYRSPFELSGGQQQKVAIASVLIMEPKILILDEPTAQLDPLGTSQVFSLIKKLTKKGITIILVSQKLQYLAEFADKVVMLENEVVKTGTPREILTDIKLLRKHKMTPSELTMLSEELIKKKWYKGKLSLTLSDAESMVKKVIKK